MNLRPGAGSIFRWEIAFSVVFSSQARYDYHEPSLEEFEFGGSLESEALTPGGLELSAAWDATDLRAPPELHAEAWWEPLESVRFILEGRDILSPLTDDGRRDESGLELPGLVVSFATEIRL